MNSLTAFFRLRVGCSIRLGAENLQPRALDVAHESDSVTLMCTACAAPGLGLRIKGIMMTSCCASWNCLSRKISRPPSAESKPKRLVNLTEELMPTVESFQILGTECGIRPLAPSGPIGPQRATALQGTSLKAASPGRRKSRHLVSKGHQSLVRHKPLRWAAHDRHMLD